MLNHVNIQLADKDILIIGLNEISQFICQLILENKSFTTIALDGYLNTNWSEIINELKITFHQSNIHSKFINIESALKDEQKLMRQFELYLGDDPVFGRVYKKNLKTFYNLKSLNLIKKEIRAFKSENLKDLNTVLICFGTGATLVMPYKNYDFMFYFDMTREEVLKRNKSWAQTAGKTQSISPKKLYYVDFPVNDKHRNDLLSRIDFYVDGNNKNQPIMLSQSFLQKVTSELASSPFRLKYMYEPGPWGGQWLKNIRHLPQYWINCAWSYELIAPEQSLLLNINNGTIIEFPWTTFFYLQYDRIMGNVPKWRFGGQFPIRFDYLDTMDGGDLSIQVHPSTAYIRKQFNEPFHQGEMYYIVDAKNGARVNLGLNESTKKDDFLKAAKRAAKENIPFNYHDYVHSVPIKKHDLLLIPPGTVHGSGEGNVVLEISATTYRYTFKIYDHLRPDLSGVMRPIHVDHAFNVIKWFRKSHWVDKNLKQEPKLIRSGEGWAEYLIGDRREFFHVVFRLEFKQDIEDDTGGKFHILTLVEGESVVIHSIKDPHKKLHVNYSETIIVPACIGKYRIVNQKESPLKIVKACLR